MSGKTRREVAQLIAADAVADARSLDGLPFTGATIAPRLGEIYAAIAALANLIDSLLEEAGAE